MDTKLNNSNFEHSHSPEGTEFQGGDRIDLNPDRLSENVVPYTEFQRRQAIRAARVALEEVHKPEVKHPNGAEIVGRASAALYFFRQQEVQLAETEAPAEVQPQTAKIYQFPRRGDSQNTERDAA